MNCDESNIQQDTDTDTDTDTSASSEPVEEEDESSKPQEDIKKSNAGIHLE